MYLEALRRVELPREPEVDDLDLVTVGRDTEHVLGLQIEMKDVFGVHVLDRLTDLTHEVDALALRQEVISVDDALEQLPARDAAIHTGGYRMLNINSWESLQGHIQQRIPEVLLHILPPCCTFGDPSSDTMLYIWRYFF